MREWNGGFSEREEEKRVQLIDYYDRPANAMRGTMLKEGVPDGRYQQRQERTGGSEEEN